MWIYKILVIFSVLSLPLLAQISPGDLTTPHAELEGLANCRKCHALEKQINADQCLDCHQLLAERIKAGSGLHAASGYKKCQSCHTEHNGRDFELIWWPDGIDKFDHAKTGYVLKGKHQELTCRKCHREENISEKDRFLKNKKNPGRTFLGLSGKCLSCHADPHHGQFDQTCETCHSMSQWKPVQTFNHQKTAFPLTGGHLNVTCAKCHPVNDKKEMHFRPIKHDVCSDCHQDPHQNRFGRQCENCHNTIGWRGQAKSGFNHDQTRYPLRGKHQSVTCKGCHLPNKPLKNVSFKFCRDCHQDIHRGAFADHASRGACEACHTIDGFSPSTFGIPEHQQADYPLAGAHLAVPCIACHKTGDGPQRFSFKNRDCQVCHVNLHGEEAQQFSPPASGKGCAFCHSFESWQSVTYDHTKTKLPLEGKHATIRCNECHKKTSIGMLRFSGLKSNCQNCHKDIHLGQFNTDTGIDCSKCHSSKDWLAEKFDHTRDSRFVIDGAHRFVACEKCHPAIEEEGVKFIRFKPLEITCASCHKEGTPKKE